VVFNRVSAALLGLLAFPTACGQRDLEREEALNDPAGSESDEVNPTSTETPPPEVTADPVAVPPASDEGPPDDLDLAAEPVPGSELPETPVPVEPPPAPPFSASFHIGADITWVQHDELYGATFVDTDGQTKDILDLMKNHGFNSVRLRTFVDPRAADGYDQFDGFGDIAHTVEMAQRVTRAGMGLYISVHLSDNWADPGKQCVPIAWQEDSFEELTAHVHDYVFELVSALATADATPQLVQVGNEITGGILRHICDAEGLPIGNAAVNGSAANWDNLGTLLRAGLEAVKEVDPDISTVLHIDKAGDLDASVDFLQNAEDQELEFDVFADTAYVRWQGQPSAWQETFSALESMFPDLSFIIPEYGNETATSPATPSTMRIANDIMFNLPDNRGLGTWFYEPEHPTQAGIGIGIVELTTTPEGVLSDPWPEFRVTAESMAVYDQMKIDFASRL
jgi:arabinogalactan endo-1,4-beta-galactosidase